MLHPAFKPTEHTIPQDLSKLDSSVYVAAVINTAHLAHNYNFLRAVTAPAVCSAVVKSDAYGMGMLGVTPTLYQNGCRHFFTAFLDEAIELRTFLRTNGMNDPVTIYVLNGLFAGLEQDFLAYDVTPCLSDLGQVQMWHNLAKQHEKTLPVILHLDTGMARTGLPAYEIDRLVADPSLCTGLDVQYVMTHMVSSSDTTNPMNTIQRDLFQKQITQLGFLKKPNALRVPASLANSGAIFLGKPYHYDLIRPGRALWGMNAPLDNCQHYWDKDPLRPVWSLWARVYQVQDAKPGTAVGYDQTHQFETEGQIATLAVGYADGYRRALSNQGFVRILGVRCPVIGRISMDLVTVDISSLPRGAVTPGQWAEVIGYITGSNIGLEDVAQRARTSGYEILTGLGPRPRKIYTTF